MTDRYESQTGIYRARDGVFLGVCKGLADYFDFSQFWVRLAVVVIFIFSGFWPVIGIYLVAAFFMKPRPIRPIKSDDEQEFYDNYVHSPKRAALRLKKKFKDLEMRLRRMEDRVTNREYDWERRFRS